MSNTRFPISTTSQGEYRADVTRDTWNPLDRFRRVIAPQGRPILDADLNEQTSILLHYLECLAQDLGGPHFGRGDGFLLEIVKDKNGALTDISVGPGRYYVQGLLCETTKEVGETYNAQPYDPKPQELKLQAGTHYVLYLDVWEEHLTAQHRPHIREVALGGLDTATRSRVVWQLRYAPVPTGDTGTWPLDDKEALYPLLVQHLEGTQLFRPGPAVMRADVNRSGGDTTSPCVTSPASHYRGPENQLYRVEVHEVDSDGNPRIKWSRENSSVLFAVADADPGTKTLTLLQWWKDDRFGLKVKDWVELVDDEDRLRSAPRPLVRVVDVDRDTLKVTLDELPDVTMKRITEGHIYLRRWDHSGNDATVTAPLAKSYEDESAWIPLEQGIRVQFARPDFAGPGFNETTCQPGDYWLIPARVATGSVEWPMETAEKRAPLPAHGVRHHYAPLAILEADGASWSRLDMRRKPG